MADHSFIDNGKKKIQFKGKQVDCIDYAGDSDLIIKGIAGSGKTLILLKRAKNVIPMTRDITDLTSERKPTVLFLVYNNSLVYAIRYLLELNKMDKYVEVNTVSKYFSSYKFHRIHGHGSTYPPDVRIYEKERCKIIKSLVEEESIKSRPADFVKMDLDFLCDEISCMFSNGICSELDRTNYLNVSRKGWCKKTARGLKQKGRNDVFDLFVRYCRKCDEDGKVDWDRYYAQLYQKKELIRSTSPYNYVFIDEAQDFTFVQMNLAIAMAKIKPCIAMDANQSIYSGRYWTPGRLGFRGSYFVRKLDVTFRSTREIDEFAHDLKMVDDMDLDADDRCDNILSDISAGILPDIVKCSSKSEEMEYIVQLIKTIDLKNENVIILLSMRDDKKGDTWGIDAMKEYLESKLGLNIVKIEKIADDKIENNTGVIKNPEILTPGVKISTIHNAKGLGYDNVIIPFFDWNTYPYSLDGAIKSARRSIEKKKLFFDEEDKSDSIIENVREYISEKRKLLYVGITRSKMYLTLTYSGRPSFFIYDFNKDHYKLHTPTETEDNKLLKDGLEKVKNSVELFDDYIIHSDREISSRVSRKSSFSEKKFVRVAPVPQTSLAEKASLDRGGYRDLLLDSVDLVESKNRGSISDNKMLIINYKPDYYSLVSIQLMNTDPQVRKEIINLLSKVKERRASETIKKMKSSDSNIFVKAACADYLNAFK